MPRTEQQKSSLSGSFPLFRVAGIQVYMHWSWLVAAYIAVQFRTNLYEQWLWNVAEYVALFGIVLLHEFGHALACRQVGGEAEEIVLWPLGGIAFVNPPARPGAVLWSIAAGPLVNLVLAPVTIALYAMVKSADVQSADAEHFLFTLVVLNIFLFLFNMLPIYPLDGGQIFQALLWFFVGRATSLMVVSIIGIIGAVAFLGLAFLGGWWFVVLAIFAGFRCVVGIQQAQILAKMESAPRHTAAACPSCGAQPIKGKFWKCEDCHARFDTFEHQAICPGCGRSFPLTTCPECRKAHPIWAWYDEEAPEARPPTEASEGL